MSDVVTQLAPYAAVANGILTLAGLGVLINLAAFARQAERTRADVIEERLKNVVADLERTKEWNAREQKDLQEKNEALRLQLEKVLSESGITLDTLTVGASLIEATDKTKILIRDLIQQLEEISQNQKNVSPELYMEAAKAYMAQKNWRDAALSLDSYTAAHSSNFDAQLLRGIAYANSRENDLMALRAYNEAIALLSPNIAIEIRSRAFVYRGAMLKRLRRFDEAQNDLILGERWSDAKSYEALDAAYNLACVYAMTGDRERMLSKVKQVINHGTYKRTILRHVSDYFKMFADDAEFIKLTS